VKTTRFVSDAIQRRSFSEIPVPDYDDIPLEDDVNDVAVGVPAITIDDVSTEPGSPGDVATTSPPQSGQQSPVTQPVTQEQQQQLPDDADAEDATEQQGCSFVHARAKLEAFTRDEQRLLAGTIARGIYVIAR
jgi:hypothetical protein